MTMNAAKHALITGYIEALMRSRRGYLPSLLEIEKELHITFCKVRHVFTNCLICDVCGIGWEVQKKLENEER